MTTPSKHSPGGQTEVLQSVERSFTIVEALRDLDGGRVYEIAEYTGLSNSTVYKHLNTLLKNDFVVKEEQKYKLGLRFLTIGEYTKSKLLASERIREKVQELSDRTGEMTHYTTEEHGRPTIVYVFRGDSGIHTRANVGQRLYMHQVAAGKAILSKMSDEKIESIVDYQGLPQATENTISDIDTLFEEIEEIRENGVAFNREESARGVNAASVPVVLDDDVVIGAVTISGPSHRLTGSRLTEELPDKLNETVNELELNIRYSRE